MKNPLLEALLMLMGTFSLAGEKSVNNSTILEVGRLYINNCYLSFLLKYNFF